MPSRSRARGLTLQPVVLDDLFEDVVEIDHGEEDDSEEEEEEDEGEEETDDDQGSEDGEGSSEEEEEEDEEGERHADFAGGDCGPSAQARVSGAAAERPTCPCPQCGKRFKQKDIINLYAPEVAIPKNELEKVLQHDKLFEEMTKRQIAMEQRIKDAVSSKRQKVAEHSDGAARLELSTSATVNFGLQNELFLDGARVIAIDASNQLILASGRATAVGPEYVLTKISMNSTEAQKIHLPPDTKTVKDMCILPGGSAIFTSLGRRLSLFSDVFVASFRPKVEASEDATTSQVYLSQTPSRPIGSGKLGHHALLRRTGNSSFAEGTTCYGNVSEIRMSRSAIIPYGDNHQEKLFAYGDESLRGVRTWQLPSFAIHSDLCPHRQPILDLRYAESSGGGTRYLGCLSDEKLQVFRVG
nr:unnamed protein product [Digitaria exilis]